MKLARTYVIRTRMGIETSKIFQGIISVYTCIDVLTIGIVDEPIIRLEKPSLKSRITINTNTGEHSRSVVCFTTFNKLTR